MMSSFTDTDDGCDWSVQSSSSSSSSCLDPALPPSTFTNDDEKCGGVPTTTRQTPRWAGPPVSRQEVAWAPVSQSHHLSFTAFK